MSIVYPMPYLKDVAALRCETIVFQKLHKFQNIVHVLRIKSYLNSSNILHFCQNVHRRSTRVL